MTPDQTHPFESIESAHEFVDLLEESIGEALGEVREHLEAAKAAPDARRVEALTLTVFKMEQLASAMSKSRRLLNDLRSLRRLLFSERSEPRA